MTHVVPAAHSPFRPFRLGGLSLKNRILKAATFEGMSQGAQVHESLIAHHRQLAEGGVAMTTVAYCAVHPDGRTFADQLYMREALVPALRALTDAVHTAGAAVSLQLGHCGGFCNNRALLRKRPLGPSRAFNALGALSGRPLVDAMTPADIEATTQHFVSAALGAHRAGFDAVELHLGHGYLLSQFLSPLTNRRRDAFGGDRPRRSRFPVEVVQRVRAALPASMPVLAKVNLADAPAGGCQIDDCVDLAQRLSAVGVDALVLSGGFVSRDAFYLFRGERPLRQMIAAEKSPLQKLALALFGPLVIRAHPFTPAYFLPLAQILRPTTSLPLVLLGGLRSLEDLVAGQQAGFELAAMARPLLHDPLLIAKLQAGVVQKSHCIPCNQCVAEMERPTGVRCVQPLLPRPKNSPPR